MATFKISDKSNIAYGSLSSAHELLLDTGLDYSALTLSVLTSWISDNLTTVSMSGSMSTAITIDTTGTYGINLTGAITSAISVASTGTYGINLTGAELTIGIYVNSTITQHGIKIDGSLINGVYISSGASVSGSGILLENNATYGVRCVGSYTYAALSVASNEKIQLSTSGVTNPVFIRYNSTTDKIEFYKDTVRVGYCDCDVTEGYGFGRFATGTSALPSITFQGDFNTGLYNVSENIIGCSTAGTTVLTMSTDGIRIGETAPTAARCLEISKDITGATTSFGIIISGAIKNAVTGVAYGYISNPTQDAGFTLGSLIHFSAQPSTLNTTTNQYGFHVPSTMTGATNNIGYYGALAQATATYNLYMVGTAYNYLAGHTGIGAAPHVTYTLTTGGRSYIEWINSGSGATTRDIETRLRETVSVMDFGATGDGSTNDRTALFNANAAGKDLYFPPGTYKVASNLTLSENCIFADGAALYSFGGSTTITISKDIIAGTKSNIFTWAGGSYSLTYVKEASVYWFGATGDGVADDQAPIQKCLDSLSSGNAMLHSGVFLLNSAVTITDNIKGIKGSGQQRCVITKGSLTSHCFWFQPADIESSKLYDIHISGMTFQTAATSVHTGGAFIYIVIGNRVTIRDLLLVNPYIGIQLSSCENVSMHNVDSIASQDPDTYFTGLAHIYMVEPNPETYTISKRENANIYLSNVRGRGMTGTYSINYGCFIRCADGIFLDGCYFGTCAAADLMINPIYADSNVTGIKASNCWFDPISTGDSNVVISGATTSSFGMIQIGNCIFNGGNAGESGLLVTPTVGTSVESLMVNGCLITSLRSHGIKMSGSISKVNIGNNRIADVNLDPLGGSDHGIYMNDVTDFVITGNNIGHQMFDSENNQALYGIYIDTGCDNYVITGNNLLGNTTGAIYDAGGTSGIIEGNLTEYTEAVMGVASATTVTLPVTGNMFTITGTTTITSVTASRANRVVTLKFDGELTFTSGNNLVLTGDLSTTANDTITLCCDGTQWFEMSRSVNAAIESPSESPSISPSFSESPSASPSVSPSLSPSG